jgi:hypothetical protein
LKRWEARVTLTKLELTLLGELVYEDMLALRELPSFLFSAVPDSQRDESDRLIALAITRLTSEGFAKAFLAQGRDPDGSFGNRELHLSDATLHELLATDNWTESQLQGLPVWIAATEEGRDFLENAPSDIKRMLGTIRPEER